MDVNQVLFNFIDVHGNAAEAESRKRGFNLISAFQKQN